MNSRVQDRIKEVKKGQWSILKLRNCGLDEIPPEVFTFKWLKILDIGNDDFCTPEMRNRITSIPDEISNLKELKRISIEGNDINFLSDNISSLKSLRILNLANNKLTELSSNIANMACLEEVHLEGNPFELIPPEIVARGISSIRNFFKELDEKDFIYEAKLIIVGEGRVGKTCISQALIDKNYQLDNEDSTEGINIQPWIIPREEIININPSIQRDLQINIWDFGGQEIYHSTHQFFLTKRSIYLLVTESRKEDRHDDFYYWLNIIKLLGDKSPIIMVLNKCDQPTKDLPIKEYKETFENIIDFAKVSLHKDYREDFNKFRKDLILRTSQLQHIGNPLPKKWVNIRIELEELKLSGKNFISESDYLEICKNHYRNSESAMHLSDYFHDLGVIMHFKDDLDLKDTVILNHEWITRGVYKILDDRIVIENKGRFTIEDIKRIWSDTEYFGKQRELISLMKNRKFDLCFELGNGEYLVPRLLPVDELDFNWPEEESATKFEIRYKFMPKGIVARLIVKMSQDIFENIYWRTGVLFDYENTKALVREKYFENKIHIEIVGERKRELLAIIRKNIADINKDFNNVEIDEMVPCSCELCNTIEEPYFFSYNLLRRYENKGLVMIRCDKSLQEINVNLLTNDLLGRGNTNERYIYCENQNNILLKCMKLENTYFIPERDSSSVYTKVITNPDKFGLRDRDFLTDPEIDKIKSKHPNYFILSYYCLENYLYHPKNIEKLEIKGLNIRDYELEIIRQKNQRKDEIISNFKLARNSYQEFKIESDKFRMKIHENKIIEYLNSDEIETFFKAFSMKDYFNKKFIEKYGIKNSELANTDWFRNKILSVLNQSQEEN
ncbi:MAG: hypothetical protein JNL57_12920 [Bacteroidetes bacterium]|nr:hypothetical protein [Bacteroidota bacterium]